MTPVSNRWARNPSQAILPRQTTTRIAGKCADLCGEMNRAVADLLGSGLVARRSAADYGGDPCVAQAEAVVAGDSAGFAGEAELVEDRIHEVAGAVAGERATGAVCAVGSGGEAADEDAGARIAEAGNGAGPVLVVLVGAAAGLADAGTVLAQTRAQFAGDDRFANAVQVRRGRWKLSQSLRQRFRGRGRRDKERVQYVRRIDRIHPSKWKRDGREIWTIGRLAGCTRRW